MTRANSVIVGSFILGALVLGVIAILAFGGMNLFAHRLRVVVVFERFDRRTRGRRSRHFPWHPY